MFDTLVESSGGRKDHRAGKFMIVTTAVYGVLLVALAVLTVFWFNPSLTDTASVDALLAPPPPPPPPPPEPKPTPTPVPKMIRQSGGVLQGSALKRVQPPYPPIAKAARAQGAVQVQVTISEDGRVIAAEAVSGHPLLKDAALQAARQWVFKPTELSGVPVKVQGILTFNFTLQ
jgi:TonB family protein